MRGLSQVGWRLRERRERVPMGINTPTLSTSRYCNLQVEIEDHRLDRWSPVGTDEDRAPSQSTRNGAPVLGAGSPVGTDDPSWNR